MEISHFVSCHCQGLQVTGEERSGPRQGLVEGGIVLAFDVQATIATTTTADHDMPIQIGDFETEAVVVYT